MQKTDYRFKVLYAIAIIMIVSGHANGGGLGELTQFYSPLYSFHVPLFLFASGYFYNRRSEDNVGGYIWKKFKTIMIPLYIWTAIYGFVVIFMQQKGGFPHGSPITFHTLVIDPLIDGHAFAYNRSAWFVAPLFYIQVINILIRKLLSKIFKNIDAWVFYAIFLCIGFIGCLIVMKGYTSYWYEPITRTTYLMSFYALGTLYKEKLEKYDKIPSFFYFAILFIIREVIILHYGSVPTYSAVAPAQFTNIIMPILVPYLGIAFWFRVCKILTPSIGKSRFVNILADHTYPIMVNHILGFFLFKSIIAVIADRTHYLSSFNWAEFKANMWYIYTPTPFAMILQVVFGIAFSLAIWWIYSNAWKLIKIIVKTKKA